MFVPNVSETMLSVSEVFGATLQGEGRSQGRHTMFIRLGLCNLDCAWCDTPYTWDWTGKNGTTYNKAEQLQRMSIQDLCALMPATCSRVVITGGEPMVQQTAVALLTHRLSDIGYTAEIETNGTMLISNEFAVGTQFNVSPKLKNSGVAYAKAINIEALATYKEHDAAFKFVVEDDDCIKEVEALADIIGIDNKSIWLMPQGRTADVVLSKLSWLFDVCSMKGYNLSARLHVLAHNDKRGV